MEALILAVAAGVVLLALLYPLVTGRSPRRFESVAERYRDRGVQPLLSEEALRMLKESESAFVDVEEYERLKRETERLKKELEKERRVSAQLLALLREHSVPDVRLVILGLALVVFGLLAGFGRHISVAWGQLARAIPAVAGISAALPAEAWGLAAVGAGAAIALLGKRRARAISLASALRGLGSARGIETAEGGGEGAELGAAEPERPETGAPSGVIPQYQGSEGGEWVGTKEAARILGVAGWTVREMIRRGELEARRAPASTPTGFKYLVRRSDVEGLAKARQRAGGPA